jgi:hypothetical protein
MDAHNVLFISPNLADAATLSGGAWVAPLAGLQARPLKRVARSNSTALADTWFDVTFPRASSIQAVGLVGHNLSTSAQVRWAAYYDAAHTDLKSDTGWLDVWSRRWPSRLMDFNHPNWFTGKPSIDERGDCPRWFHILDRTTSGQYWRVWISDQYNLAGRLEIARLVMGRGIQPEYNFTFGFGFGVVDDTVINTLEDGGEDAQIRPRRQTITITLEHMTQDEALRFVQDMQRTLGVWGEVLVCIDPTDTRYLQEQTFWGRFRQLQSVTRPDCLRYSCPFDIIEIVR